MNAEFPQPVGSVLKSLFEACGLHSTDGCKCESLRAEMDYLGVDLCRSERDRLIAALRESAGNAMWVPGVSAIAAVIAAGFSLKLNPLDPLPWFFDESVRITEERYPVAAHGVQPDVECGGCGR
jgi:hypothetical protein